MSIKGSIKLGNLYIRFFGQLIFLIKVTFVERIAVFFSVKGLENTAVTSCILLGKECSLNHPSLDKTRNGGGSCMFNSLAYNCDFQDAIGNHVSDNTSLSLSIKEKKLKIKSFPPSRRCTRGILLGFKLPGKKKWWLPISQKFPKDLP